MKLRPTFDSITANNGNNVETERLMWTTTLTASTAMGTQALVS